MGEKPVKIGIKRIREIRARLTPDHISEQRAANGRAAVAKLGPEGWKAAQSKGGRTRQAQPSVKKHLAKIQKLGGQARAALIAAGRLAEERERERATASAEATSGSAAAEQ